MPDSDWSDVTGEQARRRERDYRNDGYSRWARTETFEPPPLKPRGVIDNTGRFAWVAPPDQSLTRTETFTLVYTQGVAPPAARPVIQTCDQCDGHTDSLADATSLGPIAVAYPKAHVDVGEYGDRKGNLYLQYTVRGTILQRISTVDRSWGTGTRPPIEPPTLDLERSFRWRRKTVDHLEQGPYVHWLTRMKPKDCKLRVSTAALGFDQRSTVDELAAALSESHPTQNLRVLDDGAFAEIATLVADAPDATFALVSDIEGEPLEFELVSAAADGEPIVHARLWLEENDGGFFTVADWRPSAASDTPHDG